MRALGWLLLSCLAGCRQADTLSESERRGLYDSAMEVGHLMRAGRLEAADSAASAWTAGYVDTRAVERIYEGRATYTDTLAGFVMARQAHIRRLMGDTLGTIDVLSRVLVYRGVLPDSTAANVTRWLAWNSAKMDPAEGLRLMDTAERWARERGLNREASEIARCKAELLARLTQGEPSVQEEVMAAEPVTTDAGLLILAVAALISIAAYLLGRAKAHGVSPAEAAP
jgi:hypothetical protein